ncbi:hypothetical protein GCM10027020_05750 [Nocardioides salsibiostraticola]
MRAQPPPEVLVDLDHNQRVEALNAEIARRVESKWTVETRSDYQAVMSYGGTTNHVFHLILTILTGLWWLPVWALIWGAVHVLNLSSQDIATVSVDEQGQSHVT